NPYSPHLKLHIKKPCKSALSKPDLQSAQVRIKRDSMRILLLQRIANQVLLRGNSMTNHQFNLRFVTLILSRSLLLLVALLLAACAGPKYQQDFREGTTFENLNSYTWRKVNSEIQGVNNIQLQRLADQQLSVQGFTRTDSEPDM